MDRPWLGAFLFHRSAMRNDQGFTQFAPPPSVHRTNRTRWAQYYKAVVGVVPAIEHSTGDLAADTAVDGGPQQLSGHGIGGLEFHR